MTAPETMYPPKPVSFAEAFRFGIVAFVALYRYTVPVYLACALAGLVVSFLR